ncbi:MAG: NAD(P)/FAD-dependent oxidoreductase [Pseudomonadota bacterium]
MYDVLVIGGGIAGMSAAAALALDARVLLLEMESAPGYHATGRSAAYFAPAYGNATVRNLTAVSEPFFRDPPPEFAGVPLLRDRASLFIGNADQQASVAALQAENPSLVSLDMQAARGLVPILRPGLAGAALLDERGGDLDVDAILQGFRKLLRIRGGTILTSSRVDQLGSRDGTWTVQCGEQQFAAGAVVNAAGAWADRIAVMAGLTPLGLSPMRRTALLVDVPVDSSVNDWPLVIDVDENFYFKPDAGSLLISPADETPVSPCDAQPEELDIALAISRVSEVTSLAVQRVKHSWAGLRTFAPDRTFVVGFDARAPGFFWLAGQGGYGVQSSPGMAQLTRFLVTGASIPSGYEGIRDSVAAVSPDRFMG